MNGAVPCRPIFVRLTHPFFGQPFYDGLQEIVMLTLIEKTGPKSAGRADRGDRALDWLDQPLPPADQPWQAVI
jgi:hypothetical protein